MAEPLQIVFILRKPSSTSQGSDLQEAVESRQHLLLQVCPLRTKMMALLYKAQSSLKTSKSTLFLSICMLNRLILKNFSFSDETYSLIVGTILLICSKFIEVSPPGLRKITTLLGSNSNYLYEDFIEMEGEILAKLDYNTASQSKFYENLAELQEKYACKVGQKVENIVRTAVSTPRLYRYGSAVLLKAIENLVSETSNCFKNYITDNRNREISQISSELNLEYQFDQRRMEFLVS